MQLIGDDSPCYMPRPDMTGHVPAVAEEENSKDHSIAEIGSVVITASCPTISKGKLGAMGPTLRWTETAVQRRLHGPADFGTRGRKVAPE
ncbi:hypothetical protein Hypma_012252 [Hypsizygus marmoreus]|uniref:Uncharacterized protein n=1 Tax=Hypsizygus marmoreus TaxID=39966 RepID=A0A369JJ80_HYPMA|nr:hypothetical protein Hypma_012252 [Hypsizygus marmoreus]